jgi:hypothetical protein
MDDVQDGGQRKEAFAAGDGAKDSSLCLSFRKTKPIEAKGRSPEQGEQESNNRGEHASPCLPAGAGIERELEVLADRVGCHNGAETASSPGGYGGTRDLNVLGNGGGTATKDVFTKAMVVGATGVRCRRDGGGHPQRISFVSQNLNDIEGAALANKKCKMPPLAAPLASALSSVTGSGENAELRTSFPEATSLHLQARSPRKRLAALFFALHPAQVETVARTSECRGDCVCSSDPWAPTTNSLSEPLRENVGPAMILKVIESEAEPIETFGAMHWKNAHRGRRMNQWLGWSIRTPSYAA